MVYYYHCVNPTWPTAAILKLTITSDEDELNESSHQIERQK